MNGGRERRLDLLARILDPRGELETHRLDEARSQERRGAIECGLAAVLFGATVPLASRIADDVNAPTLAGLLYVGAAVAVLPLARRRGSGGGIVRRGGRPLVVAVAAGGFLGPLLLAAGLSRTPAATASLLLNLELVATIVLAVLFFGEHIGRRIALGSALVAVAGVALSWSSAPELRIGAGLVVAACICWGLDNCVTADLDTIAPHEITLAKGAVAGSTNLLLGIAVADALPPVGVALGAMALGAVGYGASITLWVRGAQRLGAARGQLVFSAAPFVGALVAWSMFGDTVEGRQVVALTLALGGVALVLRSGHEHEHRHAAIEHEHEHEHDAHHQHHDLPQSVRHTHRHRHEPMVHAHPHVPDLHHRHAHPG
jgi:drug/metabolite transporter (DMT)-like permease